MHLSCVIIVLAGSCNLFCIVKFILTIADYTCGTGKKPVVSDPFKIVFICEDLFPVFAKKVVCRKAYQNSQDSN